MNSPISLTLPFACSFFACKGKQETVGMHQEDFHDIRSGWTVDVDYGDIDYFGQQEIKTLNNYKFTRMRIHFTYFFSGSPVWELSPGLLMTRLPKCLKMGR